MTTNKPEVFYANFLFMSAPMARCMLRIAERTEPVVRLADYQRLQADHERLQADHEADRAADKARIAELEQCMKYARTVMIVTVQSESISQVCHRSLKDEIARIDAALGKHGDTQ